MQEKRVQETERITFVLVADASRARLFRQGLEENAPLELVEEFEHPESRAMARDLMADKPGRTFWKRGQSAPDYRTDPKDVEAEKFARSLADRLAALYDTQAFHKLVLAAPPKFLGLLRSMLAAHTNHVAEAVVASHEKDYTQLDVRTIAERIAA
ncbi:host attachment protein [Polyangium mundeleinium]|uniref:Host attachment protein n=1 Tax=Polyangium mundeleinium TaxID=2995306 RepID=A0ABT5EH39_9BACT|nr:host attachment protein [Polyangium mundeleinium]MDC0741133.1 host attachment protein [Polyangium mundeleinium]